MGTFSDVVAFALYVATEGIEIHTESICTEAWLLGLESRG